MREANPTRWAVIGGLAAVTATLVTKGTSSWTTSYVLELIATGVAGAVFGAVLAFVIGKGRRR